MDEISARPRLSLCMIVKDEVNCLQRCIDSVKDIVDEIVIVDTGSTDGTLDLAKRYASKMAHIAWIDDFSYARNISIDMATGDWILILDADNYIKNEFCSYLLQLITKPNMLAYQLMIRDNYDGTYCDLYLNTRLFRRMPSVMYTGRVHEQVTPSLLEIVKSDPTWRCDILKNIIIEHDGYMQQRIKEDKRFRNISLLTKALEDDPSDIYRRYRLALALGAQTDIGFHHLSIALEALLHLSHQEIQERAFAHELMGNVALSLVGGKEPKKALQICAVAESLFSNHPVLSFVKALSYYLTQNFDKSLSSANEALAMGWPPGSFVCNPNRLREDIYLLISRLLRKRGEHSWAVNTLRKAVAEFPDSRRLIHALIRSALAVKMPWVALDEGAKWMKSNGVDTECLLLCADAAEMHGEASSAARWRSLAGKSAA
ncbi:MAG: glycosyltransferase family 2 protein [Deltaproteobacteria bacterium]|nr:glycosyltransferase family 2 protein [Deltaproteobacteria bacterium]